MYRRGTEKRKQEDARVAADAEKLERSAVAKARATAGHHQGYIDERIAWMRAQREETELRMHQKRGELAPVEEMIGAAQAVFSAMRSRLFAVPADISHELAGLNEPREVEARLWDALHAAFDIRVGELERAVRAVLPGAEGRRAEAADAAHAERVGGSDEGAEPGGIGGAGAVGDGSRGVPARDHGRDD